MEYGILVKTTNDHYTIVCHGEYEKLYKLLESLSNDYRVLEIDKNRLDEIIDNADLIHEEIENIIKRQSELDNM